MREKVIAMLAITTTDQPIVTINQRFIGYAQRCGKKNLLPFYCQVLRRPGTKTLKENEENTETILIFDRDLINLVTQEYSIYDADIPAQDTVTGHELIVELPSDYSLAFVQMMLNSHFRLISMWLAIKSPKIAYPGMSRPYNHHGGSAIVSFDEDIPLSALVKAKFILDNMSWLMIYSDPNFAPPEEDFTFITSEWKSSMKPSSGGAKQSTTKEVKPIKKLQAAKKGEIVVSGGLLKNVVKQETSVTVSKIVKKETKEMNSPLPVSSWASKVRDSKPMKQASTAVPVSSAPVPVPTPVSVPVLSSTSAPVPEPASVDPEDSPAITSVKNDISSWAQKIIAKNIPCAEEVDDETAANPYSLPINQLEEDE